jgi:hypothetical protein
VGVLAASCGGGSPATASPPNGPTTSPAATNIDQGSSTDPGLVAEGTIKDAKSDLTDPNGKKVGRKPHIDLTQLQAVADGRNLRLSLTMAGNVPAKVPSVQQELKYLVAVEADGSGVDDYWVTLTNMENGSWSVSYTDWATGLSGNDETFPGSFTVTDNHIDVTISLTALGSPSALRLAVYTQLADHKTGNVAAQDQAPKGEPYVPAKAWLTLGP